jgi:excisionase family DNA binding protein
MNARLRKDEDLLGQELRGLFTIDELSAYLRIPKSSLYKLVHSGTIPSMKIGRHLRFSSAAIERFLEEAQKKRTVVRQ